MRRVPHLLFALLYCLVCYPVSAQEGTGIPTGPIVRQDDGYYRLEHPKTLKPVLKGRILDIQQLEGGYYLFVEDITPQNKVSWSYSYDGWGWDEASETTRATDSTRLVAPEFKRYGLVLPGYKLHPTRYIYLAQGHGSQWIAGTGPYDQVVYRLLDAKLKPLKQGPYHALARLSHGYAYRKQRSPKDDIDLSWYFLDRSGQPVGTHSYLHVEAFSGSSQIFDLDEWGDLTEKEWDGQYTYTDAPGTWPSCTQNEDTQFLLVRQGGACGLLDAQTFAEMVAPEYKHLEVRSLPGQEASILVGTPIEEGGLHVWDYPDFQERRELDYSAIVKASDDFLLMQAADNRQYVTDARFTRVIDQSVLDLTYYPAFGLHVVRVRKDSTGLWDGSTLQWVIPPHWEYIRLVAQKDSRGNERLVAQCSRYDDNGSTAIYDLQQKTWLVPPGQYSSFPTATNFEGYMRIEDLQGRIGLADADYKVLLAPRFDALLYKDSAAAYVREQNQVGTLDLRTLRTTYLTPVTQQFPLKWKAPIGITTYRHTLLAQGGQVLVATNGATRNAYGDADSLDAVTLLDGRTGRVLRRLPTPPRPLKPTEDEGYFYRRNTDLNGHAWHGNRAYVHADDGTLLCLDTDRWQLLWQRTTEYGLEGTPALADVTADGQPDVFAVSRNGQVHATDGRTGDSLWAYPPLLQDYYQVLTSPALFDVNRDGTPDVLAAACEFDLRPDAESPYKGPGLVALHGRTGKRLWHVSLPNHMRASPVVVVQPTDTTIWVATTEGEVMGFGPQGQLRYSLYMGDGLASSPLVLPGTRQLFVGRSGYMGRTPGGIYAGTLPTATQIGPLGVPGADWPKEATYPGYNTSATPVVADVLGRYAPQVLVPSELGELWVLDVQGKLLHTLGMPSGAECTPTVQDVDGDGLLDILYAGLDGYLYCYGTRSSGAVRWGQFRGNAQNTGVLR